MPIGLVAAATAASRFNEVGVWHWGSRPVKMEKQGSFHGDLLGIYYDLGDLGFHGESSCDFWGSHDPQQMGLSTHIYNLRM